MGAAAPQIRILDEERIFDDVSGEEARPRSMTLLELVRCVTEVTDDEAEVVATVIHMLKRGSVRLCGNFRNEPPDRFDT